MELQDNFAEIYQFTMILAFAIALFFFVYMYWSSLTLRENALEKEKVKQQLLENEIALVKSELEKKQLENEQQKVRRKR